MSVTLRRRASGIAVALTLALVETFALWSISVYPPCSKLYCVPIFHFNSFVLHAVTLLLFQLHFTLCFTFTVHFYSILNTCHSSSAAFADAQSNTYAVRSNNQKTLIKRLGRSATESRRKRMSAERVLHHVH
jgi:hypothetical protein